MSGLLTPPIDDGAIRELRKPQVLYNPSGDNLTGDVVGFIATRFVSCSPVGGGKPGVNLFGNPPAKTNSR